MKTYNQKIVLRIYYKMNLPKQGLLNIGNVQISVCSWSSDKWPVPVFGLVYGYSVGKPSRWINGKLYNQFKGLENENQRANRSGI